VSVANSVLVDIHPATQWSPESLDAVLDSGPYDPDIWLYRQKTVGLLKKYTRMSVEVGRLPSLLGREIFRSRVARHRVFG
jgi:hypothetical protein